MMRITADNDGFRVTAEVRNQDVIIYLLNPAADVRTTLYGP